MTLAQIIDQANNRAKSANRKVYVKKVTDRQMLADLTAAARNTVDLSRDLAGGPCAELKAALAELKRLTIISELRSK